MEKKVAIKLSEPIVVSQAPKGVKEWGPWQFPVIEQNEKGDIFIEFHIEKDSPNAYGKPKALYVSKDNGETWSKDKDAIRPGIKVANEDSLLPYVPKSISIDGLDNVKAVDSFMAYGTLRQLFRASDFSDEINSWYIKRKRKNENKYKKEKINVKVPGHLMRYYEGVLSLNFFFSLRALPNGGVCGMIYTKREIDNKVQPYRGVQFVVSYDNGHNWEMVSEIPYIVDKKSDSFADKRVGFGEQDITYLPDGSVFSLIRTTDANGPGPLFYAKSNDNMKSWSKPKFYDTLGVWPQLLTLDNGITLASYGRPGVRLRGTADSAGMKWDEPIKIPLYRKAEVQKDSCSYTGLLKTGSNSALLVYSDFNYPDINGIERKSILVRKIQTKII